MVLRWEKSQNLYEYESVVLLLSELCLCGKRPEQSTYPIEIAEA